MTAVDQYSETESADRKQLRVGVLLAGAWRRRRRVPGGLAVGLAIMSFWSVMAAFYPHLVPYGSNSIHLIDRFHAPSWHYLLGTDELGRDMFSRIMAGSRSVLAISSTAAVCGLAAGGLIGVVAAYTAGRLEELAMRALDLLMAFPYILFGLLILTALGPSDVNTTLAIAAAFVPHSARVVRAAVLPLRSREFVAAAELRGESVLFVVVRELLPNVVPTLIVEFSIRLATAVFLVSTLTFLGLGVQPPSPNWGLLVADGQNYFNVAPWIAAFPSAAIASMIIAVNLIAQGLRRER